MTNFLDLERTKLLSFLAQECKWKQAIVGDEARDQQTMIAKMARFPWEIQYIEAELRIYKLLQPLGIHQPFSATSTKLTESLDFSSRKSRVALLTRAIGKFAKRPCSVFMTGGFYMGIATAIISSSVRMRKLRSLISPTPRSMQIPR